MKILIDNGHGIETKGKRSPDGLLLEYAQDRLLASCIISAVQAHITSHILHSRQILNREDSDKKGYCEVLIR